MLMNILFTSILALVLTTVNARVLKRDVIVPPILYPTTGTQWVVGQRHNVTWDLSVVPSGFTGKGMIVLGFIDGSDDGSEHLDLDHPLANGFPIIAGRAEITVPNVPQRSDYILVLFGDSGNASGKFTIKNIGIDPPPPGSTSSSSGSTSTGASSSASSSSSGTGSTSPTSGTGADSPTQSPTGSSEDSTPSTPAGTSSQPDSPLNGAATPAVDASSTPSAISSIQSPAASPSSTTPASQTGSNNTTNTDQGNAGLPVASINVLAVMLSTICAVFVGYVTL